MSMNNNRVFFRGHDRNFYDGKKAFRYTEAEFFNMVLPWEKNATIFDNELSYCFDNYYDVFVSHGYVDIASAGVSLDTPAGAFGYIVGADGVAYSMIAKVEDRNWLHIYNADLLFEDMDNGRDFLDGVYKFRSMGAKGGTLSSISMQLFKKDIGRNFGMVFRDCKTMILPQGISVYNYLEKSYRTGWNYLQPEYTGARIDDGFIYDINSLYPYIFKNAPMPYGCAKYGEGAPTDGIMELVKSGRAAIFIRCVIEFEIKENHLPFITLGKNEAPMERGAGEIVLTYQELSLLYQQYDVKKIDILDYVYFSAKVGLGGDFVDKYYNLKENATSPTERKIYKGVLNYLTGTFAKKAIRHNLVKNGDEWEMVTNELSEPSYLYLGFSITSWGRYTIVREAQKNYNSFVYSDTDSLHLTRQAQGIEISDRLGAYKVEGEHVQACYKKRKWYGYKDANGVHLVTAGIPAQDARRIEKKMLNQI